MSADLAVKVLFVEDDELDVELAVRAMQRDQLQVAATRVDTERELVRALGGQQPDVILSDFSMPGFDGVQALRLARASAPHIPFIFLSGTIGEERAIEAIRLGATDYVLKSNMRRLGTAVRRALEEAADRQRARRAEEERSRLIEVLEATSDCVGMTDPEGRLTYVNAAGRRMLGLSGEATGESRAGWAGDLASGERLLAAMRDGTWQGETTLKKSDGREVPVSQVIIAHHAPDRSLRFFSTIARDISERKAFEKRIEYLANNDELTGLPNKTLLEDRAEQAIAYAHRKKRYCALLLTNFDRLGRVNERLGHATGDLVLKEFAGRLQEAVRAGDTVARLPGAFAVLAADLARSDDVHVVARKIMNASRLPFRAGGREVQMTISVGASIFPKDGADFAGLLRSAESARRDAKEAGGNRLHWVAAEMMRERAERMELESALRDALAQDALQLHYQPQVEIATGQVIGAEALIRWRHAERGWISPAVFIPLAEESDLIVSVGTWALRRASEQIGRWRRAMRAPLRIAVNVSARQFRDPGFVDAVAQAGRVAPGVLASLELELTESVVIEDAEHVSGILDDLRALGIGIAVDDFGTGFSSLSYLSRLPVDCLKIDRSFVAKIGREARGDAIVEAIVSLAHALDMRVIAEGVERAEELAFLRGLGCDEAQGFYYSPAVDAGAFLNLLEAGFPATAAKGGA